MSEGVLERADAFVFTLATWVYLLHSAGVHGSDTEVHALCAAIDAAENAAAGDAAGVALVTHVRAAVADASGASVAEFARSLYGDTVDTELGAGSRAARTGRLRVYQFSVSLPWLARVWVRTPDAEVRPLWLLIERVTDEVVAMDPNPWDDVDEERHLPVPDFHVLWELDGCTAIAVRPQTA